eukprot:CAMPEP_0177544190 /NCGR_PEP_ID=MMETSP0369-20130122/61847_1 /TAXON_ID=447022 ORGANISM="Scrippsiella hangoei-like, Strain SHHI-4" /NCGR_SAMPLE_ID=MMETSP0369 /ASSEMBLY_ACC=CAM_ASM_000364 /LENGTH=101 /DNA_ID=CAMNT_0019028189 /DNA_START=101 /DNA_END=402 /DNA_ORIENTATION=+
MQPSRGAAAPTAAARRHAQGGVDCSGLSLEEAELLLELARAISTPTPRPSAAPAAPPVGRQGGGEPRLPFAGGASEVTLPRGTGAGRGRDLAAQGRGWAAG